MLAALLLAAAQVVAAPAPVPPMCPARLAIPAELAGWHLMDPVAAARMPSVIRTGRGVKATLLPGGDVVYPLMPVKRGAPGTSGGVFAFEVARAGRYRVALGGPAWIDVVRDGKAIASVAHAHGADCSVARKMVDFDLVAGRYLLQVSDARATTLPLMVARLE